MSVNSCHSIWQLSGTVLVGSSSVHANMLTKYELLQSTSDCKYHGNQEDPQSDAMNSCALVLSLL
eukprot:4431121-Amphidinium_carterae.1